MESRIDRFDNNLFPYVEELDRGRGRRTLEQSGAVSPPRIRLRSTLVLVTPAEDYPAAFRYRCRDNAKEKDHVGCTRENGDAPNMS